MKDYSLRNEKSRLIQATATSLHEHITELFDNGYDQGYADAKSELGKNAIDLAHEESNRAYQQGLEDAWEAAKKIILDDGLSLRELMQVFGTSSDDKILRENTASEAIAKIKEYEEQQKKNAEVKIGDEVVIDDKGRKAVVSRVLDDAYNIVFYNGDTNCVDRCFVAKTGRHFDQIAEVLAEMRGEEC